MTDKTLEIKNKYSVELNKIENILKQLEKGRIYEISKAKMDGYLETNIIQLRKLIAELIYKIEYGKDSRSDEIRELLKIFQ